MNELPHADPTDAELPEQETENQAAPSEATPRKPYEKPEIVFRAPLESMAGVCGSINADVIACGILAKTY